MVNLSITNGGDDGENPFEEFEKEFPDQKSVDRFLVEHGFNPQMVGDWGSAIAQNAMLKQSINHVLDILRPKLPGTSMPDRIRQAIMLLEAILENDQSK